MTCRLEIVSDCTENGVGPTIAEGVGGCGG